MDDLSSSLLCQEDDACFDEEEEHSFTWSQQGYGVSEEEAVGVLVEREIRFGFQKDQNSVFEDRKKRVRMDAINWILNTRATLGFRSQTAYLSVAYLDRFLSKCSIDSEKYWAFRLLSIACLSLAAKMEECNVPALSEFQSQDHCFESRVVKRMELLVLSTLDWNMNIITPFDFLPYFIKFCNQSPPSPSKTMQLIFTTMEEVNLMDHKPSVIAAAATLVALDQQLTIEAIELRISSVPHYRFLEPREIFVCCSLIQRLWSEKTRENLLHTPNPTSHNRSSRPIERAESSQVTSGATSKRRRLTFNDDENHDKGQH